MTIANGLEYRYSASSRVAHRHHIHVPMDLRTTEEIADDEAAAPDALRETLTGLPARPGTIR